MTSSSPDPTSATASSPLLPTRTGYTPLSERLNQDVWHDNFVPEYSALYSAQPKRIILVGVWLLFGPWFFGGLATIGTALLCLSGFADALLAIGASLVYCLLPGAILYRTTCRYLDAHSTTTTDVDG